MTYTKHSAGPRGPDGLDGEPAAGFALAGREGGPGARTILARPLAASPVAVPPGPLEALLDRAELSFINEQVEDARAELTWLLGLLPPIQDGGGDRQPDGLGRALAVRATMLLSYMESGLDAFGRGPNYLSLRTFGQQKKDLLERLELADDLAAHAQTMVTKGVDQREREEALAAGLQRARTETDRLRRKGDDLIAGLKAFDELLAQLRSDVDAAWSELSKAAAEFKTAAERGHCGFDEILEFGTMVATAYATGGAALAVVAATKTALKESEEYSKNKEALFTSLSLDDIKADGKKIAGIVKPVVASIQEFRKAYAEAKAAMNKAPGPSRPEFSNDYVKLVVDKAQFDKQIEPFLELPEAKHYKSLMQRFVDLAEARNNKILERDATLSSLLSIRQDVDDVERKLDGVAQVTANAWNERVEEIASLYEGIARRLAPDMARNILNLSASVRMLFPNRPIRLVDLSLPAIKAALLEAISAFERIAELQGQPEFEVVDVSIRLSDLLTKQQAKDFVAGKWVAFSLPRGSRRDAFMGYYLVQTLRIGFEDEGGDAPICQIEIQNLGSSAIRGADGMFQMFNHAAVTARYGRGDLGDTPGRLQERGDGYIGVSPYGPWKIRATAGSGEVLRSVAKGKIKFDVEARQLPA